MIGKTVNLVEKKKSKKGKKRLITLNVMLEAFYESNFMHDLFIKENGIVR